MVDDPVSYPDESILVNGTSYDYMPPEFSRFVENLKYMGIGMVVIFVVIGVIALTTMLINWLFSDK